MLKWADRHRAFVLAALIVLGGLGGLAAGIGGYTFIYAKGASYMTNDPAACANCHVMQEQYSGWQKGSHHAVAVCNDCHTPHNLVGKYMTKGLNGYHHSMAFTLRNYPDNIQIKERNRKVTEQTCRDCHATIVQAIDSGTAHGGGDVEKELSCIKCHSGVGHLE